MSYEFDWSVLWEYRGLLLEGLKLTLMLFALGTVLSMAIGAVVGVCGASRSRAWRVLGECYVELNRNTPLVVKLFFLYFAFGLDSYTAAITGLAAHQRLHG